jgi:adenylate cyclase
VIAAGDTLTRDEIICARRALLNYSDDLINGRLEGQVPGGVLGWTEEDVQEELLRCRRLLTEAFFPVTWSKSK